MTSHEFTTSNEHHHPDVELAICYRLGALPYLPHYTAFGVYVAPGYRLATKEVLEAAGAKPYKEHLWRRPDEFSSKDMRDIASMTIRQAEGWKRPYGLG